MQTSSPHGGWHGARQAALLPLVRLALSFPVIHIARGELDGYWVYALVFALLPYAALAAYWTLFLTWRSNGDAHFLSKTAYLENKLLSLFQVLYLPIGLAVCRLWNCQDTVNPLDVTEVISTMSVDPSFACDGTPQMYKPSISQL
ncbi:unnamed protein product [Aphanomyces euteiches]